MTETFNAILIAALLCGCGQSAPPQQSRDSPRAVQTAQVLADKGWKVGENYEVIPSGTPINSRHGEVEVLEFFQYGCPHCYQLEPNLILWDVTKASYIHLRRVPVVYRPAQRAVARLYYTLKALGRVDVPTSMDMNAAIFDAIFRLGASLDGAGDEALAFTQQLRFVTQFGVSGPLFTTTYRSDAVNREIAEAAELEIRYGVSGTPLIVVNGHFRSHVGMVKSEWDLFELVNDLAAEELHEAKNARNSGPIGRDPHS